MVVLVDMDDTIENLLEAWCDYLNRKYHCNVIPQNVTDWYIPKFFPDLNTQQVFEPLKSEKFWHTVQPKMDAMKFIQKLSDEGYEVFIVTASDYRTIKVKFDCLIKRYFPSISWDHVIIASKKQMISGDVLVDDGFHNLVGGKYKKILMTAPHNKKYDAEKNGMVRVASWKEVYEVIKELKNEKEVQTNEGNKT